MSDDDVSGRLGGLSGRLGGLSGRLGGLSGRSGGIGGRLGGLSGKSLDEVHGLVLQDRQSEKVECLESRVNRLEDEILAIAEWLDARLGIIEETMPDDLRQLLSIINQHLTRLDGDLSKLDARVKKLEPHS
jgi:hypothetical protein